jgi:hypothetical protein
MRFSGQQPGLAEAHRAGRRRCIWRMKKIQTPK